MSARYQIDIRDPNTKVVEFNGALFIARRVPDATYVNAVAMVRTGAVDDKIPGLAHFFEHLPFGGTTNFPKNTIQAEAAKLGGSVGAWTSYETTTYNIKALVQHAKKALFILSDLACRPMLDSQNVAHEGGVIVGEHAVASYDNHKRDYVFINKAIHGRGRGVNSQLNSILGERSDIESITLEDVQRHFADNYTNDRLVVAAEGDVDPDQMLEWMKENFSLPQGNHQPVKEMQIVPGSDYLRTTEKATQMFVYFPIPGLFRSPELGFMNWIKNQLLIDFTTGPVHQMLRHKSPLLYTAHNYSIELDRMAADVFSSVVVTDRVPSIIMSLGEALIQFVENPDSEFFALKKANLLAEVKDGIKRRPEFGADQLAFLAANKGIIPERDYMVRMLEEVTLQQVIDFVRKYYLDVPVGLIYCGNVPDGLPTHNQVAKYFQTPKPTLTGQTVSAVAKPKLGDNSL